MLSIVFVEIQQTNRQLLGSKKAFVALRCLQADELEVASTLEASPRRYTMNRYKDGIECTYECASGID